MSFIQSKHTLYVIDKITKELEVFLKIINTIVMIVFTIYYSYLIQQNANNHFYLVAYISLLTVNILTYVSDFVFSKNKKDTRKETRIKKEKLRILKSVFKIIKYIANAFAIFISIQQNIIVKHINYLEIKDCIPMVILLVQLIFDFLILCFNRYLDYLLISLKLDYEDSSLLKFFIKDPIKIQKNEEKYYESKNESAYTEKEKDLINEIKHGSDKLYGTRRNENKIRIKKLKKESKIEKRKRKQKQI